MSNDSAFRNVIQKESLTIKNISLKCKKIPTE